MNNLELLIKFQSNPPVFKADSLVIKLRQRLCHGPGTSDPVFWVLSFCIKFICIFKIPKLSVQQPMVDQISPYVFALCLRLCVCVYLIVNSCALFPLCFIPSCLSCFPSLLCLWSPRDLSPPSCLRLCVLPVLRLRSASWVSIVSSVSSLSCYV